MIRDRGPIQNLGYGVTSRDLPVSEGETQGVSPNSGVLSKSLEGHPVMRFVAHTTASIAVAGVMTSMMIKGRTQASRKTKHKTF